MRPIILIIVFVLIMAPTSFAQNTRVPWSSLTMGYALSHAGNTAVKSIVGQTAMGLVRGSNFKIVGGFLANPMLSNVLVGVEQSDAGVPIVFDLSQNYPNPFNPSTTIRFDIAARSHVTLIVYNVLGQEVRKLVNEERAPGRYSVRLDATGLASGAYFYRIVAGSFVAVKKFLLLR